MMGFRGDIMGLGIEPIIPGAMPGGPMSLGPIRDPWPCGGTMGSPPMPGR